MSLESDIRERLGQLPDNMDQTYDVIYALIQKQQRVALQAAETTITWVMSAYRPLTPAEMFAALACTGIEEPWDLEKLLEICHNLIVLDREQNVLRFTHLSAIEFLQKKMEYQALSIHAFVSKTCLNILYCRDWILKKRIKKMANDSFTQYARLYWPFHTQLCEEKRSEDSSIELTAFLGAHGAQVGPFVDWFSACKASIQDMNPGDRDLVKMSQFISLLDGVPVASPIVFATAFSLVSYLKDSFKQYPMLVNTCNKSGQSLLMIAARLGYENVVELLLSAKADICLTISSDSCLYANVFQAAAVGGNLEIMQTLLRHGSIELDTLGGRYGYAAIAAAFYGNEKMVEFIIRHGGKTHSGRGGIGIGDALHAAARSGNESLVESLVDNGEDVNAEAGRFGTPLAWAVDRGDTSMVRFLISREAKVNLKAGIYGSPLHLAALWGNDKLAKILLAAGANPNAYDASMRTPFHETVTKGRLNKNMIDLLITHKTDPYHLDDAGWSTRDEAVWRGCTDIVQHLETLGITAERDPPNCPLKDKSETGLRKAALGEAFRDSQPGNIQWLEYTLPIIRFSCFRLGLSDIAVRAAREWCSRWGWPCDGCHRNYEGESLHACKVCHSTNLCRACYRVRQGAGRPDQARMEASAPVCDPLHEFAFVDLELEVEDTLSVWDWLAEVQEDLQAMEHIPMQRQPMLRFDKKRRTWAHEDHEVNDAGQPLRSLEMAMAV
jgi:ankyrin repeat protein